MRINHYVAAASGLSRRAADTAIRAGRVTVAGQPAQLGQAITDTEEVQLDGRLLQLPSLHTYLILHKPVGYICSRRQQGSDPTIYELLPPSARLLRPAGRLDRDSSGLLLLSDDGQFIQRYTHPGQTKLKIYEVEVDHDLTATAEHQLTHGVTLTDGPSQCQVIRRQGRHLTLGLHEGRNRQIRRTLGAIGYGVKRLHRTQIGPYHLGTLPPGHWRALPPETTT